MYWVPGTRAVARTPFALGFRKAISPWDVLPLIGSPPVVSKTVNRRAGVAISSASLSADRKAKWRVGDSSHGNQMSREREFLPEPLAPLAMAGSNPHANRLNVDPRLFPRGPVEMLVVGLVAFGLWTEMDVVASAIHQARSAYYEIWYIALAALLLVLGVAYRSVALPFGLWLLSAIGGEDALFYILQLRTVPPRLPWLDGHLFIWQPPTNVSITGGLIAGVAALVGLVLLERSVISKLRARRQARPKSTDSDEPPQDPSSSSGQ